VSKCRLAAKTAKRKETDSKSHDGVVQETARLRGPRIFDTKIWERRGSGGHFSLAVPHTNDKGSSMNSGTGCTRSPMGRTHKAKKKFLSCRERERKSNGKPLG